LSPVGRATWDHWRSTRDQEFCDWFETEVYGESLGNEASEGSNHGDDLNLVHDSEND
jgi:hypothetical protein